jgi:hypothetical protein
LDPQQFEGRDHCVRSSTKWQRGKRWKSVEPHSFVPQRFSVGCPSVFDIFWLLAMDERAGEEGKFGLSTQLTSRQLATPIATRASPPVSVCLLFCCSNFISNRFDCRPHRGATVWPSPVNLVENIFKLHERRVAAE